MIPLVVLGDNSLEGKGTVVQLSEMTWPMVEELPRETPVVIPVAALEQHGHHMPVFTDSMLLGEVIRRTAEQLREEVLFTPVMWLGNSEHHLDFPGTMSAGPRTYLDLLQDMVENFLHHGFDRIVVLNGHGGNVVPSQHALYELRQNYREWDHQLLISATYWDMASISDPEFVQKQMGHAGEWETSMMLALRPDLVRNHSSAPEVEFGNAFPPGVRAWVMKDRSEPGHIGSPGAATEEKGKKLFDAFATGTVAFLRRVVEWDGTTWNG